MGGKNTKIAISKHCKTHLRTHPPTARTHTYMYCRVFPVIVCRKRDIALFRMRGALSKAFIYNQKLALITLAQG